MPKRIFFIVVKCGVFTKSNDSVGKKHKKKNSSISYSILYSDLNKNCFLLSMHFGKTPVFLTSACPVFGAGNKKRRRNDLISAPVTRLYFLLFWL